MCMSRSAERLHFWLRYFHVSTRSARLEGSTYTTQRTFVKGRLAVVLWHLGLNKGKLGGAGTEPILRQIQTRDHDPSYLALKPTQRKQKVAQYPEAQCVSRQSLYVRVLPRTRPSLIQNSENNRQLLDNTDGKSIQVYHGSSMGASLRMGLLETLPYKDSLKQLAEDLHMALYLIGNKISKSRWPNNGTMKKETFFHHKR